MLVFIERRTADLQTDEDAVQMEATMTKFHDTKQTIRRIERAGTVYLERLIDNGSTKSKRDAIKELMTSLLCVIPSLVEGAGGETRKVNPNFPNRRAGLYAEIDEVLDGLCDSVDDAFQVAIDAEDEAREMASDEHERSLSRADSYRDERKHAGAL